MSMFSISSTKNGLPSEWASTRSRTSSGTSPRIEETSSAASSGASGVSESVVAFCFPAPQVGRISSSSRRAVQTSRTRVPVSRLGQALDQVEQRARSPVDVLHGDDRDLLAAERLDVAGPPFLQAKQRLARIGVRDRGPRQGEPDRPGGRVQRAAGVLGGDDRLDRRPELGERGLGRIVVEDAGVRLRHLGERPVGDALAVGQAAADQHVSRGEPLDELAEEARLADAGRAEQRDELRRALALDAGGDGAQHGELLVPPDERRDEPRDAAWRGRRLLGRCVERDPRGKRLPLALRVEVLVPPILDRPGSRGLRALPDEHSPGSASCCRRAATLTASPLTISSPRVAASRPATTSARVDADPEADLGAVPALDALREGVEAVADGERGPNGALGVVLVRLRDAEDGEHGVAGELLGRAAEALDLGVDQLEELPQELAEVLRVDQLAERSRAREVGEEDGDDAAFLPFVAVGAGERPRAARCRRRSRTPRSPAARRRSPGTSAEAARRSRCRSGRRPGSRRRRRRRSVPRVECTDQEGRGSDKAPALSVELRRGNQRTDEAGAGVDEIVRLLDDVLGVRQLRRDPERLHDPPASPVVARVSGAASDTAAHDAQSGNMVQRVELPAVRKRRRSPDRPVQTDTSKA